MWEQILINVIAALITGLVTAAFVWVVGKIFQK